MSPRTKIAASLILRARNLLFGIKPGTSLQGESLMGVVLLLDEALVQLERLRKQRASQPAPIVRGD